MPQVPRSRSTKCNLGAASLRPIGRVLLLGLFLAVGSASGAEPNSPTPDTAAAVERVTDLLVEASPAPPMSSSEPAEPGCTAKEDCPESLPDAACGEDRTWVGLEYLLWWRKGGDFPPLLTTQPHEGVLPGGEVLWGGEPLEEGPQSGARLEVGRWLDDDSSLGIVGHFVALGDTPTSFSLSSFDVPYLARPFFDASRDNAPDAQIIASNVSQPPTVGRIEIVTESEFLAGDVLARLALLRCERRRLDLLAGYQFGRLDESLGIQTLTQIQQHGVPSIAVRDAFATQNEYHGALVGLLGQYQAGCWSVELLAKSGFGPMHQVVTIDGSTTVVDSSGGTFTRASGLLVQATNAGEHGRDEFCFMEDVGVKLTYAVTDQLRLSLGYSLIYWSNVVRPGDQIDLSVDSRLFSGATPAGAAPTHPAFAFDSTDYFVQGMNAGLEYRF